MKKLIISATLLFSVLGFSQKVSNKSKIYLIPTDIVKIDTLVMVKQRKFIVNSGTDKLVNCKIELVCSSENYKKAGFDNINTMLMETNIGAKYKVKNKLTYQPIKMLLYFSHGNWKSTIEFGSQNDFGVLKSGKIYYSFDENYQIIDSETIISN